MLIPIYLPAHFVLATIDFVNSKIYYMDSILHRDGRHIFEKLNAYGKYLREYFLDGDQSDFEFVDLKQTIPHQGNGYDCGCHVIWNMIQYINGIKSYRKMPSDIRQIIALWILSKDHTLVVPSFKENAMIIES